MTEEQQDNMVLRLLREMRGDVQSMRHDMITRFTKLDRGFGERREATVAAVGWAGFAKSAADHHGAAIDAVRLELEELRARIAALEARA